MKRFMQILTGLGLFAWVFSGTVLFSAQALAHGKLLAKHGGVVSEANDMVYELVAMPDRIVIYVEDHGKNVDTTGASGKLILLKGKEKTELALVPAGENKLEAKGPISVAAGTKVVSALTLAGKPPTTVRFVLK